VENSWLRRLPTASRWRSLQVVLGCGDYCSLSCHCVSAVCFCAGEQAPRREEATRLDVSNPQTHPRGCHRRRAPQSRMGICFDQDDVAFSGENTTRSFDLAFPLSLEHFHALTTCPSESPCLKLAPNSTDVCVACAEGTYKNKVGNAACSSCHTNSQSPVASIAAEACYCVANFSDHDLGPVLHVLNIHTPLPKVWSRSHVIVMPASVESMVANAHYVLLDTIAKTIML